MSDEADRVIVGYLVTHHDGYEARLGPDLARAQRYAAQQHGVIEPMYVLRPPGSAPTRAPEAKVAP